MVCDGPDPPDHNPHEMHPPARHDLIFNGNLGEDSDDEQHENFGYEPLPQTPNATFEQENFDEDSENDEEQSPPHDLPDIVSIDVTLSREVWSAPRPTDPIQMDNEKAQQVMSAMANIVLPQTSIPEWAQSIPEDQWKQSLKDKLETLKVDRPKPDLKKSRELPDLTHTGDV